MQGQQRPGEDDRPADVLGLHQQGHGSLPNLAPIGVFGLTSLTGFGIVLAGFGGGQAFEFGNGAVLQVVA